MAEKTKKVASVQLLADIKKCCEKHGLYLAALRFSDEIDIKKLPPFQYVKIEILGGYRMGETEDKKES